jgi:hypothetical protein
VSQVDRTSSTERKSGAAVDSATKNQDGPVVIAEINKKLTFYVEVEYNSKFLFCQYYLNLLNNSYISDLICICSIFMDFYVGR